MTDDVSWENSRSPATRGKQPATEFLTKLHGTVEME